MMNILIMVVVVFSVGWQRRRRMKGDIVVGKNKINSEGGQIWFIQWNENWNGWDLVMNKRLL